MNLLRALLMFLLSAGTVLGAAQNSGSNQANAGQTGAASPQAAGENVNGDAASTSVVGPSAADDAALQGRIQQALRNEPALASSAISVKVTDSAIEVAGTVPSAKDKQTAERIAESFDGNRKFENKLLVTGQNPAAGQSAAKIARVPVNREPDCR